MKRARFGPGARMAIFAFLLAAGNAVAHAGAQESPLGWLNGLRRAAGASTVGPDAVLSETAQRWAAALAASGVLSHRGADGSSVLDRFRARGGTDAHVGEIVGAGPDLAAVEKGWTASADHRNLAANPSWTHAGWGTASSGASVVWVILFCERLVDDLRLERSDGELVVTGAFLPREAARGLLYAGLDLLQPAAWDPGSRRFSFTVPGAQSSGYFRLGYLSAGGAFRLTNAFTLPRGTGSPGETTRSGAPAQSP